VRIFGEQHDQPDQQRQVAAEVARLAADGTLGGLVLEMAEAPHSTVGLPRDADAAAVRAALRWHGWPWSSYAEVVMHAVRAGVPVWGGNLPRDALRAAISDGTLDIQVPTAARAALAEAVRDGHCGLLPAGQLGGMVRMQIARDRSMAQAIETALRHAGPNRRVVLLTGAQHASRDRGVPLHLQGLTGEADSGLKVVLFGPAAAALQADERRPAEITPQPDYCESLRRKLGSRPDAVDASASAASATRR
jgi:uncharacterized iron-regulated protein